MRDSAADIRATDEATEAAAQQKLLTLKLELTTGCLRQRGEVRTLGHLGTSYGRVTHRIVDRLARAVMARRSVGCGNEMDDAVIPVERSSALGA